uniref:Uncharacterized protein n=1 Tax=Magallana gigas TaxID=29159 RepID=K1R4U3_MAGGI
MLTLSNLQVSKTITNLLNSNNMDLQHKAHLQTTDLQTISRELRNLIPMLPHNRTLTNHTHRYNINEHPMLNHIVNLRHRNQIPSSHSLERYRAKEGINNHTRIGQFSIQINLNRIQTHLCKSLEPNRVNVHLCLT